MSEPDSLESRVADLEADLTNLREHGTLDLTDRYDSLGRLDRQLRGLDDLDEEERFDAAFGAAFAEAFLFPPSPDFPACLWRQASIHELAAHAAAFVPGGWK